MLDAIESKVPDSLNKTSSVADSGNPANVMPAKAKPRFASRKV